MPWIDIPDFQPDQVLSYQDMNNILNNLRWIKATLGLRERDEQSFFLDKVPFLNGVIPTMPGQPALVLMGSGSDWPPHHVITFDGASGAVATIGVGAGWLRSHDLATNRFFANDKQARYGSTVFGCVEHLDTMRFTLEGVSRIGPDGQCRIDFDRRWVRATQGVPVFFAQPYACAPDGFHIVTVRRSYAIVAGPPRTRFAWRVSAERRDPASLKPKPKNLPLEDADGLRVDRIHGHKPRRRK